MSSPKHPFRGDHCAALVDLSILLLMCSWTDVPNLADTKAFAVAKAIGMSSFRCSLKGLFTSSLKTPAPAAVASSACSARFRLTLARLSVGSSGRTAASILRVRASLVRKALATLLLPVEIVLDCNDFLVPPPAVRWLNSRFISAVKSRSFVSAAVPASLRPILGFLNTESILISLISALDDESL